jgi:2-polyprenyl-3-methyl-5-hydroxy-6-metoxy-1,4-benzoquinol methylase
MKNRWNERFSETSYAYGIKPNQFLKDILQSLNTGKILFPAEGEGRNAVYSASLGWEVDALDYCESGKVKAEKLASEQNVKINYLIKDLSDFSFEPEFYDVIALIYMHLDDKVLQSDIHKKAIKALKPGGKIIFEAFEKEQIKYSSGGPKEEELLFSLEDIVDDFIDLNFEIFSKELISLDEGKYHQGRASVVRFVGTKS